MIGVSKGGAAAHHLRDIKPNYLKTMSNTEIPNAVSAEQLNNVMYEKPHTAFKGMTAKELVHYILAKKVVHEEFGAVAPAVDKCSILLALTRLEGWHVRAVEQFEEAGDAETAQYYKTDAEVIRDIINRLKGVQVKNEDLFYQQYESRDGYLSRISDESLEVLQHFGEEAPVLLNKYACAVEDALIEQVKKNQELIMELKALKGEAETKQGNILDSVKEKLGAMKAGIFSHC